MIDAFSSGGVLMWPMLAVALGILGLVVRAGARIGRGEGPTPEVDRGLQAILFWGVTAVLLGVLGTVVGLVIMTRAITLAGAVEAPLVWGGVGVSLVTLIFGLLIFLFASLAWFTLRQWSARIAHRRAAVEY